jgi:diguanylate cyclase (GGDEF)-like protein/PAS domain S-box-containing protein
MGLIDDNKMSKIALDTFLVNSYDAIAICDKDDIVLKINPAFEELFGWRAEEVVGQSLPTIPNYLFNQYKDDLIILKAGQSITAIESKRKRKDGSLIDVSVTSTPIKDENGQVLALTAVYRDIGKQKERERQLRENEKRYLSLVTHNSDAIYTFDLEGNFQSANNAGELLVGYTEKEILGESLVSMVDPDDIKKCLEYFNNAKNGEAQEYEIKVINAEGQRIDCLLKYVPIIIDEHVVGVFGIAKDITKEKRMNEAIRISEERYKRLMDNSPNAIFIHTEGFIDYTNQAAVNLLNASGKEQIIGRSILNFLPIKDREAIKLLVEQILHSDTETMITEARFITIDGQEIEVECTAVKTTYMDKEAIHTIVKDISERKRMEKDLLESEERYRLIAENSRDLIQLLNRDGDITYASPSHSKVLGRSPSEIEGNPIERNVHSESITEFEEVLSQVMQSTKHTTIEIRVLHGNGKWIWITLDLIPIIDEEGAIDHILLVGEDITKRKIYEEKIHEMAFHDSLTGLPNRRLFHDRLTQALTRAKRNKTQGAILYLDCDNFKSINDDLGHDAGDEFLQFLAEQLVDCVRESDTVARIGGDEFIILMPDIQNDLEVDAVAERIVERTKRPWKYNGQAFHVTSSVGSATYPKDSTERNELIKMADKALYKAKESGKSTHQKYNSNITQI